MNTVERLPGLNIDHTIIANFAGFSATSEAIGGVRVCLPGPVYQGDLDPNRTTPGRLILHASVQKVSGVRALQYVRVRHGLGDGSDIGRIRRQQVFLGILTRTIRHCGLDPTRLWPLIDAAMANLAFDATLNSPAKLLDFALDLRHLKPGQINFVTVRWAYEGARVRIVQPAADRLWASLDDNQSLHNARDASTESGHPTNRRVPSTTVNLYNRTTNTGLATATATRIQRLGFRAGDIANAAHHNHVATRVEYGLGQRAQARYLSQHLSATLAPRPGAGLRVVLGTKHTWTAHPGSANHRHAVRLPPEATDHLHTAKSGPCSNDSYG